MRFWATLGGLGTMYDVHLGLIGKRVVDFIWVITELFSLYVTAEALRAKIGDLLQLGQFNPKFQVEGPLTHVEGVVPHRPFFSQKTRLNDRLYGIKISTDYSFILSQFTRLTDRRTNRRTEFSSPDRVCIAWSAVINHRCLSLLSCCLLVTSVASSEHAAYWAYACHLLRCYYIRSLVSRHSCLTCSHQHLWGSRH